MSHPSPSLESNHPLLAPVLACSLLGLVIAVALSFFGTLAQWNEKIHALLTPLSSQNLGKAPFVCALALSLLVSFGVSFVILDSPGMGRRIGLFVTALLLLSASAPLCALWGIDLQISMPLIALLWSGVCALFYASRHHMPCDE